MSNALLARIDGKNCIMDSQLAAELVKLSPHPLHNCSNCGVVKRKDTWCTCVSAEEAQAKWELSQRLSKTDSQTEGRQNATAPPEKNKL